MTQHTVDSLDARLPAMLTLLDELVSMETPTDDLDGLARMAARLQELFAPFGEVERFPQSENGEHFVVRIPGRADEPPALALCHYDTVWPLGSLAENPFRVEDGIARGPGVF